MLDDFSIDLLKTEGSRLLIGPVEFNHQVQKIAIQEQKAVEVIPTTRTDRNLIVDSGNSTQKAQIRLLFTGLDEINSLLRSLIALFRTIPVVSVRNELLSQAWQNVSKLQSNDRTNSTITSDTFVSSRYIPVALEELILESVPSIPFAIQATIVISRVDVSSVSDTSNLLYQGEQKDQKSVNPKNAFWLVKWIDKLKSIGRIPELTEADFRSVAISWYAQSAVGLPIEHNYNTKEKMVEKPVVFGENSRSKIKAESCAIKHIFAYQKLIGKGLPIALHMGMESRAMSLDIVFNDQDANSSEFSAFVDFKETSDSIIRSLDRMERVSGWLINSPIAKLLSCTASIPEPRRERIGEGVYVPISFYCETSDSPFIKEVRIDLVENNIDYFKNNEITWVEGGTDYTALKKFFEEVVLVKEQLFRSKYSSLPTEKIALALTGAKGDDDELNDSFSMFQLFWPIDRTARTIQRDGRFGVLNIDSIRAAFLHSSFDRDQRLVKALRKTELASGRIVMGDRDMTYLKNLSYQLGHLNAGLFGPNLDDPGLREVTAIVREYVSSKLLVKPTSTGFDERSRIGSFLSHEELIGELTLNITKGLLGDRASGSLFEGSSTGTALQTISTKPWKFHPDFTDALFQVIVERSSKPEFLDHVYSIDGLQAGFFKLIAQYIKYLDLKGDNTTIKDITRTALTAAARHGVYEDLTLPSYFDLYGDQWENFAPTFDDLGVLNWEDGPVKSPEELRAEKAVGPADIVEPGAWFFHTKYKNGLRIAADRAAEIMGNSSQQLSVSLPFNVEQIAGIEKILKDREEREDHSFGSKSLDQIIKDAFEFTRENDDVKYRETIQNLRYYKSILEDYRKRTTGPGADYIKVYIHNADNMAAPHLLSLPGLGGEILRVADQAGILNVTEGLPKDADETHVSAADLEVKFVRNLADNNKKMLQSSIDQVPDNYANPSKLFPAAKVFLIEKRGNDIIADDSFFSVNPIISIDITLDKDDADLAVIKLADPLYRLQSAYFSKSNLVNVTDESGKLVGQRIRSSNKNDDVETYLRRYKIAQGRAIQIRMGYTSMPKNMDVVFTGRITEIEPGDTLTIVAQGWKAELINRQVSFVNDNPKSWGARDLAIQTIVNAAPDGFGDYFSERDAYFLLKNINNYDAKDMILHSLENLEDVDVEKYGYRDPANAIGNWFATWFSFRSTNKKNLGLDTRLKNIWYPDTAKYTNFLGIKSRLGTIPAYVNDGWIVPLQSSWEVLKEASRHAWNCIVQVVPFDSEATIFMGHPDQPYFYTKGGQTTRSRWRRQRDDLNKKKLQKFKYILDQFLESPYYFNSMYSIDYKGKSLVETVISLINIGGDVRPPSLLTPSSNRKINYPILVSLAEVLGETIPSGVLSKYSTTSFSIYTTIRSNSDLVKLRVDNATMKSGLPLRLYNDLKSVLGEQTPHLLLSAFYGLSPQDIAMRWSSVQADMQTIMGGSEEDIKLFTENMRNIPPLVKVSSIYNTLSRIEELIPESEADFAKAYSKANLSEISSLAKELGRSDYPVRESSLVLHNLCTTFIEEIDTLPTSNTLGGNLGRQLAVRVPFFNKVHSALIDAVKKVSSDLSSNIVPKKLSSLFVTNKGGDIRETFIEHIPLFRAFVYYFASFCLDADSTVNKEMNEIAASGDTGLPATMKVFRVHHLATSDKDIIENKIVATTREMWNSVVVEHPAIRSATSLIKDTQQLFNIGRYVSAINWIYYPKQEITGVLGLQFHPGMTLSNKKLRVFTELNCQTPPLAAKLACTHLAEGMRRMYRGNLLLTGRVIKPHDRIVLADRYTEMYGPIEVESVVHHWNPDQGWITNISPQCICDANPGAAVLQTAAMEGAYDVAFNIVDNLWTALSIATAIATLGASTPTLAMGNFSVKKGLSELVRSFKAANGPGMVQHIGKNIASNFGKLGSEVLKKGGLNPMNHLRLLFKNFGGPVQSLAKSYGVTSALQMATHFSFKLNVISAFIDSANEAKQLPVIISPLMFNGIPFTAGLETEDVVFAIHSNDSFYAYRDLQASVSSLLGLIQENPDQVVDLLTK